MTTAAALNIRSNDPIVAGSDALAHLSDEDVEAIGVELDAIRDEILASRGADDAAYIRKVVKIHRYLESGGRVTLLASILPPAWLAGTAMLSTAKILESLTRMRAPPRAA